MGDRFYKACTYMKIIIKILFVCSIFFAASCKKEYIGSYDENYIGEWHSRDTLTPSSGLPSEIYFIIDGKNSEYGFLCQLACGSCPCQLLTSGNATINKKHSKLYIGKGFGNKRVSLDINAAPHLNSSGKWECTIEDVVMIKK